MSKKIKIPKQLKNDDFGFNKLLDNTKKAFENEWQKNLYSSKTIQPWIDQGFNYGVAGGKGNLIIIDADNPEIVDLVENNLPEGFTVKTPGKGMHYYFICKDIPIFVGKIIKLYKLGLPKTKENHYGEIMVRGGYVVGPSSIHPDTKTPYIIEKDLPISEISFELILSTLVDYIDVESFESIKDSFIDNTPTNIMSVLKKDNITLKKSGNQLVGIHPIHGSKNGKNFVVHPDKQLWRCFRCGSGGGTLSLIAVLNKIIPCKKALPKTIRGDLFTKTITISKDKYGINTMDLISPTAQLASDETRDNLDQ